MLKTLSKVAAVGLGLVVLAVLLYQIPFIHDRLEWRVSNWRTQIKYALQPPDEVVFVPGSEGVDGAAGSEQRVALAVEMTLTAFWPTPTVTNPATPTLEPGTSAAGTPLPSPTATIRPTAIPEKVILPGVVYVDQHHRWNYCGPANLAMALNYWGWSGKHDDVAKVIKPGVNDEKLDFIARGKTDKNVMPYEMVDFVNEQTGYRALVRHGGEEDLIKRLIAAGFPVLIEKGYYERDYSGKVAWMGHYLFVTGYDDSQSAFTVQDAYLKTGRNGTGQDLLSDYPTFQEGWRGFNYLFMVIYPPEKESEVMGVLGSWADPQWANQHALELANQDITATSGNDLYFSWFNKGTSLVQLAQYPEAAVAYDQAFQIYAGLDQEEIQRPYRMMWYQSWPYWAYFYSGRYQDVINLADITLNDTIDQPTLEESLYWRGMAKWALGDVGGAVADLQQAVYYNPNFSAGLAKLAELGAAAGAP